MKKFTKLVALIFAVVMAFCVLPFAACAKDKTDGSGEGEESLIPDIPVGKNLSDVALDGDSNSVTQQLGLSNLKTAENVSYKVYSYLNSSETRSTFKGSEKQESGLKGKFLSKNGKSYYSSALQNDSYRYSNLNYNDPIYSEYNHEYESDYNYDISSNMIDDVMYINNSMNIKIVEDGSEEIHADNNIALLKGQKIDTLMECTEGAADVAIVYSNSLYYYINELTRAIYNYLDYKNDNYHRAYWGAGGMLDDLDNTPVPFDILGNLKDYVTDYTVTLKAGDNAFFADFSRKIEINIEDQDGTYLFDDRIVLYVDMAAENSENDFNDIELTDEEKAIPCATLDPDDLIQRFENGEAISLGTVPDGGRLEGFCWNNQTFFMYDLPIEYNGTNAVLPAGAYSTFLAETGISEDTPYELHLEYRNSDNTRSCILYCYSE